MWHMACKKGWTDQVTVWNVEWGDDKESCIRLACMLSPPNKYGRYLCMVAMSGSVTRVAMRPVPELLWTILLINIIGVPYCLKIHST